MDTNILNENQNSPKKGRGGARPNSGRKVGSTVKLSAQSLLGEIAKRDVPFEVGLAEDYIKARQGDDKHLLQRYQHMLLSKVLADKVETDITSKGESVSIGFTFPKVELDDWKQ